MTDNNWIFLQGFLKAPKVVASVIPSSGFLKQRVVASAQIDRADVVVELGPGTGGLTKAMLTAMSPNARLLALEFTSTFMPTLQQIADARLEVVNDCASTLHHQLHSRGLAGADAIVSGIPFSTMPDELAAQIAQAVAQSLRPGGRFVAYQVSGRVVDHMRSHFGEPETQFEARNIPPQRVFTWRKPESMAPADRIDGVDRLAR